jgi:hypothetical protein
MTMAYAANHTLAGLYAGTPSTSAAPARAASTKAGPGFFSRLASAFMESRQRAAEREIARHRYLVERMRGVELAASHLPFTRD